MVPTKRIVLATLLQLRYYLVACSGAAKSDNGT